MCVWGGGPLPRPADRRVPKLRALHPRWAVPNQGRGAQPDAHRGGADAAQPPAQVLGPGEQHGTSHEGKGYCTPRANIYIYVYILLAIRAAGGFAARSHRGTRDRGRRCHVRRAQRWASMRAEELFFFFAFFFFFFFKCLFFPSPCSWRWRLLTAASLQRRLYCASCTLVVAAGWVPGGVGRQAQARRHRPRHVSGLQYFLIRL